MSKKKLKAKPNKLLPAKTKAKREQVSFEPKVEVSGSDLISVALSDRCELIQVTDFNEFNEEAVYQIVNTATLDNIFVRASTLKNLAKAVRTLFGE